MRFNYIKRKKDIKSEFAGTTFSSDGNALHPRTRLVQKEMTWLDHITSDQSLKHHGLPIYVQKDLEIFKTTAKNDY
jgi:hypothetical protein